MSRVDIKNQSPLCLPSTQNPMARETLWRVLRQQSVDGVPWRGVRSRRDVRPGLTFCAENHARAYDADVWVDTVVSPSVLLMRRRDANLRDFKWAARKRSLPQAIPVASSACRKYGWQITMRKIAKKSARQKLHHAGNKRLYTRPFELQNCRRVMLMQRRCRIVDSLSPLHWGYAAFHADIV